MASTKINIVANFIGNIWSTLIGLIFVPVYIRFIGMEAYGLLGLFATLQAVLSLLDMGLSTTLNREVARYAGMRGDKQYINNLTFTLERIYISISVITGLVLVIVSWFFATQWVNTEKLSDNTVILAFVLMAVNFACQFPVSLYQGGLLGLQRQVTMNVIMGGISTVKAIGAVLILWLISPSITAFLTWQLCLSICQFFLLRKYLWKYLPPGTVRPFFDKSSLRTSGRYAAGIMSISILSVVLTQSDKIIISKIVKLTEFGYYTLATTISTSLNMALFPVISAVFPRMTELVNNENRSDFVRLFHRSSQLIALLIMPLSISLFIFSNDIILGWTRNPTIAQNAGPILKFLVIGTGINSLMTIPYQYTLAIGWLRYGLRVNVVSIFVFLPFIIFAAYNYGAIGGAMMWMILNIGFFIFAMLYLFSRKLSEEKWKWYFADNLKPLLVCILTAVPFFLANYYWRLNNLKALLLFGACLSACYIFTFLLGTPSLRPELTKIIEKVPLFQNKKTKAKSGVL